MQDNIRFDYQENEMTSGAAVVGPPSTPLGAYKFSPDEQRVLRECNSESFYQRSMPIGTLLGLGAYSAVQTGKLRPNPRFGAAPKMTLAVIIGYFIGKLSYQEKCAEKLMALPGSYIGQLLRERKEGHGRGPTNKPSTSMFGAGPNDIYSDAGPGSSLDLDTDRPSFDTDTDRPDISGGVNLPLSQVPGTPALTYDELRRKNRTEYSETKQDPYRMDPSLVPPVSRARTAPPPPTSTNKYGDVVE